MSEEIKQRAYEMTRRIYDAYGTDTDILFGIPPELKGAVQSVILSVLENIECSDKGVVLK